MNNLATRAIERVLYDSGEPFEMKLTALCIRVQWSKYYLEDFGKPKQFILQHSNIFCIVSDGRPGNDIVMLVREAVPQHQVHALEVNQLPEPQDLNLYRPFDHNDNFMRNEERRSIIIRNMEKLWDTEFSNTIQSSPLRPLDQRDAKEMYAQAYYKCARLSILLANVSPRMDNYALRSQLSDHVRRCGNAAATLYFFKDDNVVGRLYSLSYATLWCPGNHEDATLARDYLVDVLNAGFVQMNGITLGLLNQDYGNAPCISAVRASIRELLADRMERMHPQPQVAIVDVNHENVVDVAGIDIAAGGVDVAPGINVNPVAGINIAPGLHVAVAASPQPPPLLLRLPIMPLWPDSFSSYNTLHEPVVDCETNQIVAEAVNKLQQLETRFREECARQELLDIGERFMYANMKNMEWIGDETYELGCGAEARIYAGLYKNPAHNDEKQLVAVKQNFQEKSLFNSQERDHFVNMGTLPGVVKYHCGFLLRTMTTKHDILVQDIGCMSLSQLITRNAELAESTLQPKDKFRITKALAMAVQVLHSQNPSIVHRDIRPENVLIMPNGTLCLTDFGLARRSRQSFAGSSVHTNVILTTMQPYEVQECFKATSPGRTNDPQHVRVGHEGDIFMLGCVMAFVNTGMRPFDGDDKIADRKEPNLGNVLPKEQPWLAHLLRRMMHHDADCRPSIDMVLRHPYFKTIVQNFDETLTTRIERCIVNDFSGVSSDKGPIDDDQFKALESLLLPIERKLVEHRDAGNSWHDTLSDSIFAGKPKLPFYRHPIAFQGDNADKRAFPLPEVAKLVKWLRNVLTHFHGDPVLQDQLRRSRSSSAGSGGTAGEDTIYDHAGEFFLKHSAVCWFLPLVWQQHVSAIQVMATRQKELSRRHQEEKRELDEANEALDRLFM